MARPIAAPSALMVARPCSVLGSSAINSSGQRMPGAGRAAHHAHRLALVGGDLNLALDDVGILAVGLALAKDRLAGRDLLDVGLARQFVKTLLVQRADGDEHPQDRLVDELPLIGHLLVVSAVDVRVSGGRGQTEGAGTNTCGHFILSGRGLNSSARRPHHGPRNSAAPALPGSPADLLAQEAASTRCHPVYRQARRGSASHGRRPCPGGVDRAGQIM